VSALLTTWSREREPRYGSPAELAAYAGLSVKTVRRLVGAGKVRAYKVGRRVLVPFEDMDRFIVGRAEYVSPERSSSMATVETTMAEGHYVPRISDEEQARRNKAAIALLDSWETEGDEQDQRETLAILKEALGKGRTAAARNLFP
jgi:excisionase family DNA binding protein